MLLTGDIEARAESTLLRRPDGLAASVLKVPHHGSRTSSTSGFVAAVAPRVAVISVGADNRYRLPAREIEARYRAAGACVLRTDRCGAIVTVTDGRRLTVRTARSACGCAVLTAEAARRAPAIAEAQGMQIASFQPDDGLAHEDRVVAEFFVEGMAGRHGNDAKGRELAGRRGEARVPPGAPSDARPTARTAGPR
jgi:hypothetical protein